MRKKIWGVLLTLALCLGVLCVGAGADYVEEGDESCDQNCIAHAAVPTSTPGTVWRWHFKTLQELGDEIEGIQWIADNYPSVTVKFLTDVTVTKPVTFNQCSTRIILDLNGHTISGNLDAPMIEVNFGYGADSVNGVRILYCIAFQNGTIQNTGSGAALQLSRGAATLENVNISGDLALAYNFAGLRNSYTPTFLGGSSFTRICPINEVDTWSRNLSDMLGAGCYFADSSGVRIDADILFGSNSAAVRNELVNVRNLACDHKDASDRYTLFEDAQTKYHAPAMRCTVCGNLCPHDKITGGQSPACAVCGLPIAVAATNFADKIDYGPYYYTGFDDAMSDFRTVHAGRRPTITLLADTSANEYEWWKANDDGITIDLAGHDLTLHDNETTGWVTIRNTSGTHANVFGKIFVKSSIPTDPELIIPETGNDLTIEEIEVWDSPDSRLAGGSFGKISVFNKTLASLLASGYCFTDTDTGAPVPLYNEDGSALTKLTNVTVAKCSHNEAICGARGVWTCPCGQVTFAASVTKGGAVKYYKDMQDAFNDADGGTVNLIAARFPEKTVTVPADVTAVLDLSKSSYDLLSSGRVEQLYISGALTVVSGGSVDWVNNVPTDAVTRFNIPVTVGRGGTLTVPAEYSGGSTNRLRLEENVTVEAGGRALLNGGVCGYIAAGGSVTINGGGVERALVLEKGSTAAISSGTIGSFMLTGQSDVTLSGGSFGSVRIYEMYFGADGQLTPVWPREVTFADFAALLTDGKAFQLEGGSWANDASVKSSPAMESARSKVLETVTVADAPVAGFAASVSVAGVERGAEAAAEYGELSAGGSHVDARPSFRGETAPASERYQWYLTDKDGARTEIQGADAASLSFGDYAETRDLTPGVYTFVCMADFDGFVCYSTPAAVTVTPRVLRLPMVSGTTDAKVYDGTTKTDLALAGFYADAGKTVPVPLTAGVDFTLDGASYESPAASDAAEINWSAALLSPNYVFPGGARTTTGVTGGRIEKAPAPAVQDGALIVASGQAGTYFFDFKSLLPEPDAPMTYGTAVYGAPDVSLTGYDAAGASVDDGVLTLSIPAAEPSAEGEIGSVTVTVTTQNYRDVTLTLKVSAAGKKLPAPDGSAALSRDTLTYGETLSAVSVSGTMNYDGTAVPGTFTWQKPDAKLTAGTHTAVWVFTPAAQETYLPVTGTATVTVAPAKPAGPPKYTLIKTGGKTLADAALSVNDSWPAGEVNWVSENGRELSPDTEVQANVSYRWVFTPYDTVNYTGSSGSAVLYTGGGSSGGSSSSGGGSSSGSDGSDPTYSVSAPGASAGSSAGEAVGGSVSVSTKNASAGDTVTVSVQPEEGYRLEGLTVVDKNGNEIPVTEKNGKYTFTMPASQVKILPVFAQIPAAPAFPDVPSGAYYAQPVKWAAENGITGGTKDGGFAPGAACTRAQIVTFLWRAAGCPEPEGTRAAPGDVSEEAYYAKAVLWALENGVTNGRASGGFDPSGSCTRAQAVTFLARALNADGGSAASFHDVPADSYYAAAVAWAVENGVTNGTKDGGFSPNAACTRAQIVTFLFRAYEAAK